MLQDMAKMALDFVTNEPANMATPTAQHHPMGRRERPKKLFLRIKKDIWNAQDPFASSTSSRTGQPKLRITLKQSLPGVTKATKNHSASKGSGKGKKQRKQTKKNASSATVKNKKRILTLRLPKPADPTLPLLLSTSTPLAPTAQRASASAHTSTHQLESKQSAPSPASPFLQTPPNYPTSQQPRPRIRPCNIKTSRFIPGGRNRSLKGQDMNSMHLEQPCLQPGCKSCAYWFPGLVDEDEAGDFVGRLESVVFRAGGKGKREGGVVCEGWTAKEISRRRPVVEALSPIGVGPQIEDQRTYEGEKEEHKGMEKERGRKSSTRPQMRKGREHQGREKTPSPLALPPPLLSPLPRTYSKMKKDAVADLKTGYEIMLPRTLIKRLTTSQNIPAKTAWRSTPRKSYIAKLKFQTKEGRQTYAALVRKGEEFDKLRAMRSVVNNQRDEGRVKGILKAERGVKRKADDGGDQSTSASAKKKVRFRQRVKLGFGSVEGRERFRRVVEGL